MSEENVIIIRTIEDLLPLDERQLEACLKDLKTWVKFRKQMDSMLVAMSQVLGTGVAGFETQDHMVWVDDGIEGGKVNLTLALADAEGNIIEASKRTVDDAFSVDGEGKISVNL